MLSRMPPVVQHKSYELPTSYGSTHCFTSSAPMLSKLLCTCAITIIHHSCVVVQAHKQGILVLEVVCEVAQD